MDPMCNLREYGAKTKIGVGIVTILLKLADAQDVMRVVVIRMIVSVRDAQVMGV
jgi:hypothetical protein